MAGYSLVVYKRAVGTTCIHHNVRIPLSTKLRVAPHFDARGNVTRVDFWLFFKALDYHEGFQHAHTLKVLRWSQDATYELDLVNDRQRRFHVELIFPDLESDLAADGDRWGEYKVENREMFERIDQALLEEHIEIAENWPS